MDYIVLDLEMTGLNPKTDEILEIGAVKIRQGVKTEVFHRMVKPSNGISEKIQEITGITQKMAAQGEELDYVMEEFLEFLEEDVIIGHNIILDFSFLKQWAINRKRVLERKAVDTLKIARKCLPHLEKRNLESLCSYYGIRQEISHRALEDAAVTWVLYQKLAAEFLEKEPSIFTPKPLIYKAKRQTPATAHQKNYLKELSQYHRIELELSLDTITRSEASRYTDQIIQRFGKMVPRNQKVTSL